VLDSRLSLPGTLRLFRQRSAAPTLVAHVSGEPPARPPRGVEYLRCRARRGRVDLGDLLERLGRRGVATLLVEGGAEVNRAFLDAGLVDELLLFVAPRIAGGGLSWLPGPGVARMRDALPLHDVRVRRVGDDVLVSGRKLAGVLAEAASGPSGVEWVVLGIGVNVSLDATEVPEEIRATVTSLGAEGAPDAGPADVAARALARLGLCYDALRSRPGEVLAAWRARAVPWWGEEVEARTGGGTVRGRLLDLDEDGALVLGVAGGERRRLLSGEVARLRPAAGA
jgi:biotin-(acetyl-CoA carboxylase) ligase